MNWTARIGTALFSRSGRRFGSPVSKLFELRAYLESLEDRVTPATFLVTNTNDSGAGSFRQAILDANSTGGTDTIQFSIGTGAQTIALTTSAFDTITEAVTIDGTSQPGYAGVPLIELRGDGVTTGNPTSNKTGITIGASNVTVQGLVINRFANEGIWINSGTGSLIQGNYIGTDLTGTLDKGNTGDGIFTAPGANSNRIIGNVISGNDATGILLESNSNKVQGNRVGTNAAGTAALGNLIGVWMYGGQSNFIGVDGDGVNDAAEGNVISGNSTGVYFQSNADNNVVAGNLIGLNAAGTAAVGNTGQGIRIFEDNTTEGVRIGTNADGVSDDLERNVISANGPVNIFLPGTKNIVVAGNYIGTNAAGTATVGVVNNGIALSLGSTNVRIGSNGDGVNDDAERNVIAGHNVYGVGFSDVGTSNNTVAGNYIGTDKNGTAALGNATGVLIQNGVINTTIGGTTAGARNVISGNTANGVDVSGSGTTGNVVLGNFIGTNAAGTGTLANNTGVQISTGASNNTIGTAEYGQSTLSSGGGLGFPNSLAVAADGNAYVASSANPSQGTPDAIVRVHPATGAQTVISSGGLLTAVVDVDLDGPNDLIVVTFGAVVRVNIATGSQTLVSDFTIPGQGPAPGTTNGAFGIVREAAGTYLISDYDNSRILRVDPVTGNRTVLSTGGNLNGPSLLDLAADGSVLVPNFDGGTIVRVDAVTGAQNIVLGGFAQAYAVEAAADGSFFFTASSSPGDFQVYRFDPAIGTPSLIAQKGLFTLTSGVAVEAGGTLLVTSVSGNPTDTMSVIRLTPGGARNVISGNTANGVQLSGVGTTGNTIRGNYIGTNAAGTADLGNSADGVLIDSGAANNTVGGPTSTPGTGAGNVISGNGLDAGNFGNVHVNGATTTGTIIQGNIIGLNAAGTAAIDPTKSSYGVYLQDAPALVGGTAAGARNVISGHTVYGVVIEAAGAAGALVQGNLIGTNVLGAGAVPNAVGVTVAVGATGVTIGGGAAGAGNVISGNTNQGVVISANSNTVQGNIIGLNAAGTGKLANNVGIDVGANSILIGTDGNNVNDANERNVISGNTDAGIVMIGGGNHRIAGNYIGTKADGTAGTVGNGFDGIYLQSITGVIIGTDGSNDAFNANEKNIIAGNGDRGIVLEGANVVAGNWIGLDITGASAGTQQFGIQVTGTGSRVGTDSNGKADTEERNVISGNTNTGVIMSSTSATIAGNYIGTDSTGLLARPNGGAGISIGGGGTLNTIGGATAAERNVISGNTGSGVTISGSGTTGNFVRGNYIGTNAVGTGPLGNSTGVTISTGATNNIIGGFTPSAGTGGGNVISGNTAFGINVAGATSTGNVVRGNIIGLGSDGSTVVGNGSTGVTVANVPLVIGGDDTADGTVDGVVQARNVISGNLTGISLSTGTDGSIVSGNIIGLDRTGTLDKGNTGNGIGVAANSTIGGTTAGAGNIISGNDGDGISIGSSNIIAGNIIGLDITGNVDLGNAQRSLRISGNSNTIGGTTALSRNVIAGTSFALVSFVGTSDNNSVIGNYIGTDFTGTKDRSGTLNGIALQTSGTNNTIGATAAGAGNVISGANGPNIQFFTVNGGTVQGNTIGLGSDGNLLQELNSDQSGISIQSSKNITIGGTAAGARNIISGNTSAGSAGVGIQVISSQDVTILGNHIGTGTLGTEDRGNRVGIQVENSSFNVIVGGTTAAARNVISGNTQIGLGFSTAGTGNVVQGNYIGVDSSGNVALANGDRGIFVGSTPGVTIGGLTPTPGTGAGNVISGNAVQLTITGTAIGNQVEGNIIGLDAGGTSDITTSSSTLVEVAGSATNNLIGTGAAGSRNIISGGGTGVALTGTANGNYIRGNYIGTDITGTLARPNGAGIEITTSGNTVGGPGARNVISGNSGAGVRISGVGASNNIVFGNYIGTKADGLSALGNTDTGVYVFGKATGTVVGGIVAGAGNVISGSVSGNGVVVTDAGTDGTIVQGNFIGTNATGTAAVPNNLPGVAVGFGATNTQVGGLTATPGTGAGNVISGNKQHGVMVLGVGTSGTVVRGNLVGLAAGGTAKLGNGTTGSYAGVAVFDGAANTTIGGTNPQARNVISGNENVGIGTLGTGGLIVTNVVIQGNYVGTDITGTVAIPNGRPGVFVFDQSANVTVGGTAAGAGNLVSGNAGGGVFVANQFGTGAPTGVVIQGNRIGTTADGLGVLPNTAVATYDGSGVSLDKVSNMTVGGITAGAGNLIRGNVGSGVSVKGTGTSGNAIRGNSIFGNGGLAIDLGGDGVTANDKSGHTGPNGYQNFPVLSYVGGGASTNPRGVLNAAPLTTYTLDFYANATTDPSGYGPGQRYLGSATVTTNAIGRAIVSVVLGAATTTSESVSVTAIDPSGNTSEFAESLLTNLLPTITLNTPSQALVGVTLPFTPVLTDPIPGKTYRYSWTVTYNGSPIALPDPTYVTDGATDQETFFFTPQRVGGYAISVTVTDSRGGVTTAVSNPIQITATTLGVTITGNPLGTPVPFAVLAGQPVTLTSRIADPRQTAVDPKTGATFTPNYTYAWSVTRDGLPFTLPSGTVTNAPTLTFTPTAGGLYLASLAVTDGPHAAGADSVSLYNTGTPSAQIISNPGTSVTAGTLVTLQAVVTDIALRRSLTYAWTVTPDNGQPVLTGTNTTGVFLFNAAAAGNYVASVSITDDQSRTGVSAPVRVRTTGAIPTVTISGAPFTALPGVPLTLTGTATDADPNRPGSGSANTYTLSWSTFGSASPATASGNTFTFTPTAGGTLLVSLTATDQTGARTSVPAVINVAPPTAGLTVTPPASPTQGQLLSWTATLSPAVAGTTYSWSVFGPDGITRTFNTGTTNTLTLPTGALRGRYDVTVTATANGFSYTATPPQAGTFAVVPQAPITVAIAVSPPVPPNTTLREGDTITLTGTATEPGVDLTNLSKATYLWTVTGPNGFSQVGVLPTLSVRPLVAGTYTATLTVRDFTGGVGSQTTTFAVTRVPPQPILRYTDTAPNNTIGFQAVVPNPSGFYTFTYTVQLNGQPYLPPTPGGARYTFRVPPLTAPTLVSVIVTDSSGASTTLTATLKTVPAGTTGSPTLKTVTTADFLPGTNVAVLLALGNSTITADASLSKSATVEFIAVGGNNVFIGGPNINIFQGDSGTNALYGGDGPNTFFASGNDTLVGGAGTNLYVPVTVDATTGNVLRVASGAGANTIDLSQQYAVRLNLSTTGSAQPFDAIGNQVLLSGSFQSVLGSSGADSLTAASGASIAGGGGNDLLVSNGANNVTLSAGSGLATLQATGGSNVLLIGGKDPNLMTATNIVNVSLVGGSGGNDSLIAGAGSMNVSLVGGSGNNDSLVALGGNVSLIGGSGNNDSLIAGTGATNVSLIGGSGQNDSLIALGGSTNISLIGGSGGNDTLVAGAGAINVSLVGSSGGNDSLIAMGGSTNVSLIGGSGHNDTLVAGSGAVNVSLVGGSGSNDSLVAMSGTSNISLIGGSGNNDTLVAMGGSSNISLIGGSGNNDSLIAMGGASNISLVGGSGSNDSLVAMGGSTNISLIGGSGNNDTLVAMGGSSNVMLIGGSGHNDSLVAGTGATNVSLIGGSGSNDTLIAMGGSSSIILVGGSGNNDSLIALGGSTNISLIGGSGNNDTLVAGAGATNVSLIGGSGNNDSLIALSGSTNVLLIGGSGNNDTLVAGGGSTNVSLIGGSGNNDSLVAMGGSSNISLVGGSGHNDSLVAMGGSTNVLLIGGSGNNDSLIAMGGSTNVSLVGGSGHNDTLVAGAGAINVSLVGGSGSNDSLVAMGGSTNVTLIGGSGNNDTLVAMGGSSNISLVGGSGNNDSLFAGANSVNVSLIGGSGSNDTLVASPGSINVTLIGGSGNNDSLVATGGTNVSLIGGSGDGVRISVIDTDGAILLGGLGHNAALSVTGTSKNVVLIGGFGHNDSLTAGAGVSGAQLVGGFGHNDYLSVTGVNNAVLVGGFGNNDSLTTSSSNNVTLLGGFGDNALITRVGGINNYLIGQSGHNDSLISSGGGTNVSLLGGSGNNLYLSDTGSTHVSLFGGSGHNDTVVSVNGTDVTVFGGNGNNDSVSATGGTNVFAVGGTGNSNRITATNLNTATVFGGAGHLNTLVTSGGTNVLAVGGTGYGNRLESINGTGNTLVNGGNRLSSLVASGGNSVRLFGGGGEDFLSASGGTNIGLFGQNGDNTYSIFGTALNPFGGYLDALGTVGLEQSTTDQLQAGTNTILFPTADRVILDLSLSVGGAATASAAAGVTQSVSTGVSLYLIGLFNGVVGSATGNDYIHGNALPNSLVAGAGNSTLVAGAGDATLVAGSGSNLLVGGTGKTTYAFRGSASGTHTITQTDPNNTDVIDLSKLSGPATLSLASASAQAVTSALTLTFTNPTLSDVMTSGFGNTLSGNARDNHFTLSSGNNTLTTGTGLTTLKYTGGALGTNTITAPTPQSVVLNFHQLGHPVAIDLSQPSQAVAGGTVTFAGATDGRAVASVVGTIYADVLRGNPAPTAPGVALYGGGGRDSIVAGGGDDFLQAGVQQVVYLDFDTYTPLSPGNHEYTQYERDAIQQRLDAIYNSFTSTATVGATTYSNGYVFTQSRAAARTLTRKTGGEFVTIYFNKPPAGGQAEEVDFANADLGGTASVNASLILGAANQPDPTTTNFIALSAGLAAHELAHLSGLRHTDAFGPIGTGAYQVFVNGVQVSGLNPSLFYPYFQQPTGSTAVTASSNPLLDGTSIPAGATAYAYETPLHIMGSPASLGLTRYDTLNNLFFGEREAIRQAFNQSGVIVHAQTAPHGTPVTAQDLGSLPGLVVPNTLLAGAYNYGQSFAVGAIAVVGSIGLDTSGQSRPDYYSFAGHAGDIMSFEIISNVLPDNSRPLDTILRVYDSAGNLLAMSDDELESRDSLLFDFRVPTDGKYFVQVDTWAESATANTSVGDYVLYMTSFNRGPSVGGGSTLVAGPGNDVLYGGQGNNLFRLAPGFTGAATVIGGNGADVLDRTAAPLAAVTVIRPPQNVSVTQLVGTLPGIAFPSGLASQTVTKGSLLRFSAAITAPGRAITYSLEAVPSTTYPTGASVRSTDGDFNWTAGSQGTYTVRVVATAADGATASIIVNIAVSAIAPVLSPVPNQTVPVGGAVALHGSVVNPVLTDTYTYAWVVTRNSATVGTFTGPNYSFTPGVSGTYTATLTVTNVQDGLSSTTTSTITVNEVAPTIAPLPSTTIPVGGTTAFTASYSYPGSAVSLTLTWVVTNSANQSVATGSGPAFTFTAPDADVYTVTFTVQTASGLTRMASATVTASAVPPTATPPAGISIAEGTSATLTFADPFSPAPAVVTAGFRYSFSATAGGLSSTYAAASTSPSYTYAGNDAGTFTVYGRIIDKNNQYRDYTTQVVVTNVQIVPAGAGPFTLTKGTATGTITVATFTDAGGPEAVSRYTATIDWGDGTTSTVGTIGAPVSGVFPVSGNHTYATQGNYTIRVTLSHDTLPAVAVTDAVTVVAPPVVGAGGFAVPATKAADTGAVTVATFTDPTGPDALATYSAVINWGDGTSTSGAITLSGSTFTVRGIHTYASIGSKTITVTLRHQGSPDTTVTSTATVVNPPLVGAGVGIAATRNAPTDLVPVATFTDPGGPDVLSSYTATINWGDSTSSTGSAVAITLGSDGRTFTVSGSHSYSAAGSYPISVTIQHGTTPPAPTTVSATATVSNPAVSPTFAPFSATAGVALTNQLVASFLDPSGPDTTASYTATINWGDGTTSTVGTIGAPVSGIFPVTGTHTYAATGTFAVTVTIVHGSSPPAVATGSVTIAGTQVTPTGGITAPFVSAFSTTRVLATFTDPGGPGTASSYTATIAWGDGTTSAGTITGPVSGVYSVSGTHMYFRLGSIPVTVSIARGTAAPVSVTSTANIATSILAMNPTLSGAITLSGSAAVTINGTLFVNSNSSTALRASGSADISVGSIRVVGGYSATGSSSLAPTPITQVVSMPDPLASLPVPANPGGTLLTANVSGSSNVTLNPGRYTKISVSGSGRATLNPGVYIIQGGGLSVSGSGTLTGNGVFIYVAGSNFPSTGGTYNSISFTGSAAVSLYPPTSGPYAGITLFQSRDNNLALTFSGSAQTGIHGFVYAPNALLNLSGSNTNVQMGVIVDRLNTSGSASSGLVASGTGTEDGQPAGELLSTNLYVYVNPLDQFTQAERDRIQDAIDGIDALLAPYSIDLVQVTDAADANVVIDLATTSVLGGVAQGVLAAFDPAANVITIIDGWDWYAGSGIGSIGSTQVDFQTVITHELGHALGLGHLPIVSSVMYDSLAPGATRRALQASDLNVGNEHGLPGALYADLSEMRTIDGLSLSRLGAAIFPQADRIWAVTVVSSAFTPQAASDKPKVRMDERRVPTFTISGPTIRDPSRPAALSRSTEVMRLIPTEPISVESSRVTARKFHEPVTGRVPSSDDREVILLVPSSEPAVDEHTPVPTEDGELDWTDVVLLGVMTGLGATIAARPAATNTPALRRDRRE